MLWTVVLILLVLWFFGLGTGHTFNGLIHLLILVAVAAVIIRAIQGKNPV